MCLSSVNWRDQFANVCNFYFKPEADWYEFETTLFFGKACMLNFNSKVRRHWLQGAWVKFERKKKVLSYSHKITTNHFPRRACTCSPTLLGQHIFLRPVSNCDQFTDQRVDVPPYSCQNCSWWPATDKTRTGFLLNHPSLPTMTQSVKGLNRTELLIYINS